MTKCLEDKDERKEEAVLQWWLGAGQKEHAMEEKR